ncbi:hypothetical protein AOLI_G00282950 [Acnodon oligacanthus]
MPSKTVWDAEVRGTPDEAPKNPTARSRKRKADVAVHLQDPDEEVAEMTRKKQCPSPTSWNPSLSYASPCRRIPMPDKAEEPVAISSVGFTQYTSRNIFVTPHTAVPPARPVLGQ